MKVIIAHPLAAAELAADLDATVSVVPEIAARLLADGFARLPESKTRSPRTNATPGADTDTEGA